ncbi:hypothetical protein A0J61_01170 [Choanephora cucurbitarum]|uniref:Uncharacterized protein n=1 Tax=Choanephora cucurbitarum TaxID=101091 RepID=A0A1C7NNR5_9FUNG|nr:hypothetical protein A0J61_01170 [Choanephora cucurbitarum]
MIPTNEILYLTSVAFEVFVTLTIAWKTFAQPKKVRYVLLIFCILTLPSAFVNVATEMERVPDHWNSFCYLVSTCILLLLHFWLNLDIGRRLRTEGIQWRNVYMIITITSLVATIGCLLGQIIILLVNHEMYPRRPLFIAGVCLAIACDSGIFVYSFSTLIHLRDQRHHQGQSRATALGVWFLSIQAIWYLLFGALYIWFFFQDWSKLSVMLAFDYIMRSLLCLMFAWPPPDCIIEFMSERLFNTETYQATFKDNTIPIDTLSASKTAISYGHQQQKDAKQLGFEGCTNDDDLEEGRPDIFFSSNIAIVSPDKP